MLNISQLPSKVRYLVLASLALAACAPQGELVPPATPVLAEPTATAPPTETEQPTATTTPEPPTATPEPQPATIRHIEMDTTEEGWAIGGPSGEGGVPDHILVTADGGLTWRQVTPSEVLDPLAGAIMGVSAAYFAGPRAWVQYASHSEYWRTEDRGSSWQSVELGYPTAQSSLFTFSDLDHGWLLHSVEAGMGSELVALLRTSDGGDTWEEIVNPYESEYLQSCFKTGLDFAGSDIGWLTYDCQGIYVEPWLDVSFDGGLTWETRALPLPEGAATAPEDGYCIANSPHLFSEQFGLLAVTCFAFEDAEFKESEYVYLTEDLGETWIVRDSRPGDLHVIGDRHLFALRGNLYRSSNLGANWTRMVTVSWGGQFSFVDSENGWAVTMSDDNVGLARTRGGGRTWESLDPLIIYD